MIGQQAIQKRSVDLHRGDGQGGKVHQVDLMGPEVVDGDLGTFRAHFFQIGEKDRIVLEERAVLNLDAERSRRDSGLIQHLQAVLCVPLHSQDLGAEIDRDAEAAERQEILAAKPDGVDQLV